MDERERLYGSPPGVEVEYRVRAVNEAGISLTGPTTMSYPRAKDLYLRIKADVILGQFNGIAEVHLERRALRYVPFRGWVPA